MEEKLSILSKEIHARAKRNFQRVKVPQQPVNKIWSADLSDMTNEWIKENNGYRYILTVIDVGSRYAHGVPLKDKKAETVSKAFKSVIDDMKTAPKFLWVDKGSEFYNKTFKQNILEPFDIEIYSTYSEFHSPFIERLNQTLKNKMWRYFTEHQTRKWIDILPKILNEYNTKDIHSSINMTPEEYYRKYKNKDIKKDLPKFIKWKPRKLDFKLGDMVRISRQKGVFEKGYVGNWSYEVFFINKIIIPRDKEQPVRYGLREYDGDEIEGSFYKEELQKVNEKLKDFWLVEKVLRRKKVGNKKMMLVKWLGWPDKYNSWEDESNELLKFKS